MPPRNPDAFSSPNLRAPRNLWFYVAPSEAMLFTLNMFFTLDYEDRRKMLRTFSFPPLYEIFFFTLKRYCVAEAGFLILETHSSLMT